MKREEENRRNEQERQKKTRTRLEWGEVKNEILGLRLKGRKDLKGLGGREEWREGRKKGDKGGKYEKAMKISQI